MRTIRNLIFILVCWASMSGCNLLGGFRPAEIVKHPDAPLLIAEVKGEYIRAYVYDKAKNELTDFGWVHLENSNAKGWTLQKFDWEALIERREKAKARETGSR